MARANLNKSDNLVTNTTTSVSKYTPKRPKMCINSNPQTSLQKGLYSEWGFLPSQ